MLPRFALPCLLLAALGCDADAGAGAGAQAPFEVAPGCNPLAAEHDCLLPFPSDFFLVADQALPSGKRVLLPEPAQPRTDDGKAVDLLAPHPADGFSPGNQILALFSQGIDDTDLVGASADLTRSLDPAASPTLLVEAESGAPVLHLAEIDPRAEEDLRRALVIRPLVRLQEDHRYVVAIHGLRGKDGALLPAPEGFRRIRDGGETSHPSLAPLAGRYDNDIFAPLGLAGLARAEVQLAWDFTVRSRENAVGDLCAVREQVIAYYASHAPAVKVVKVDEQPDKHTFRRITASVEVPLFLEDEAPGSRLARDAAGAVRQSGTVEVPFSVLVPKSVAALPPEAPPARLLQFGHGFFGGREEANDLVAQLADERGFVVVAADWWGMSKEDVSPLLDQLTTDLGGTMLFTDRVHQAMANFMAVAYAAAGPLLELPELELGPSPLYDPAELHFYGLSQGAILGGTYVALSPHVERAVLGVGG
ncbi:MAG: hypothetical protein HY744_16700, partial [Deltaproteobacteria bacterium]|nr:hypothetical protein [Deltaproteobacteria bacterium]